jgi:hypothetical protein
MRRFFSSIPSTTPPTRLPLNPDVRLLNFRVPFPEDILRTFSLATANQKEITDHKIGLAVLKYQKRDGMYIYICIYIYMHIYIYICIYMYIYT